MTYSRWQVETAYDGPREVAADRGQDVPAWHPGQSRRWTWRESDIIAAPSRADAIRLLRTYANLEGLQVWIITSRRLGPAPDVTVRDCGKEGTGA